MPRTPLFDKVHYPRSLNEAATAMNIIVFDTALPQDWVDRMTEATGINPYGLFVWSYDRLMFTGAPVPLCEDAVRMLLVYEEYYRGNH